MSARPFRVGDIVRSKITGRTGPVLRVEQYDHGTPRITAELTKGYDTGVPGHHFELVRSADDGRVHDVVEAERQAYVAETGWEPVLPDPYSVEYARALAGRGPEPADIGEDDVDRVDPEDPTSMVVPVPGDRVLMADGGTARVTARRMDGDVLSLQVQRPRMGYAEWVGVEEIAEISEPEDEVDGPPAVSSQAGLSAIRHGVVPTDDASSREDAIVEILTDHYDLLWREGGRMYCTDDCGYSVDAEAATADHIRRHQAALIVAAIGGAS